MRAYLSKSAQKIALKETVDGFSGEWSCTFVSLKLSPGIASRTSITVNVDGISEFAESSWCYAGRKDLATQMAFARSACLPSRVTACNLACTAAARSNGIIPTQIASHEAQGLHAYRGLGSIMLYEDGGEQPLAHVNSLSFCRSRAAFLSLQRTAVPFDPG